MKSKISKIGFGGSCHWCTEAIFQSLKGVFQVDQGWISSNDNNSNFSEAVLVHYNEELISFEILIQIHLETHSCTSNHSMREKYRSAIYFYESYQEKSAISAIINYQINFNDPIITKVIPFVSFKLNSKEQLNYYYSDQEKPFCKTRINSKLNKLLTKFTSFVEGDKINTVSKN